MAVRERVPAAKAWGALLVAWMGLALWAALLVDRGDARLLLPVLAALAGAIGLWRPRPYAGPVAAVLAAGLFVLARLLLDGPGGLIASGLVVLVGFAGLGALAEALARQTELDNLRRRHDGLLIEELTPTDSGTGALKWPHASRHLGEELARARRYRYTVSLLLVGADDWAGLVEQRGADRARALRSDLARAALAQLRVMDRVCYFGEGDLALILPHTALDGALLVVEKLRSAARDELAIEVRAGVAEFPADGATPEDLTREAAAALDFARASSLGVASRSLLQV